MIEYPAEYPVTYIILSLSFFLLIIPLAIQYAIGQYSKYLKYLWNKDNACKAGQTIICEYKFSISHDYNIISKGVVLQDFVWEQRHEYPPFYIEIGRPAKNLKGEELFDYQLLYTNQIISIQKVIDVEYSNDIMKRYKQKKIIRPKEKEDYLKVYSDILFKNYFQSKFPRHK